MTTISSLRTGRRTRTIRCSRVLAGAAVVAVVAAAFVVGLAQPTLGHAGAARPSVAVRFGPLDPTTLSSPNVQSDGSFGGSVATSGGIVAVGAPYETATGETAAGHVYVYSTKGALLSTLTSPNAAADGIFGFSVAVSGKNVLVGAPGEEVDGMDVGGRAYLFSSTGHLVTTFVSPSPQSGGYFGYAVALAGSTVVIGAPGMAYAGQSQAGLTYIFRTGGTLVSTLFSPKAAYYGQDDGGVFGYSVGISGSKLIIGAPGESSPAGNQSGHVYLFKTSDSALLATWTSPNGQPGGYFGYDVGISGSTVVIGAPQENSSGFAYAGNAYLYSATTYALLHTLASPNEQSGASFGYSVSISKSNVLVGVPDENLSAVVYSGGAYEFSTSGAVSATFSSPNAVTYGSFGYAVATGGTTLVVGAPGETVSTLAYAGHAYLY